VARRRSSTRRGARPSTSFSAVAVAVPEGHGGRASGAARNARTSAPTAWTRRGGGGLAEIHIDDELPARYVTVRVSDDLEKLELRQDTDK
jgi:hypothetical protein